MSKYLDRWMSKISGPIESDVPDDLMALVQELDRRLATGSDEDKTTTPDTGELSRRFN